MIIIESPLYIQLSNKLINKITNELSVGDFLPSERKLTEIYGVSRTTVRLALSYLEKKGYISIQHGKGSLVVEYYKTLVNLGEMYSFTEKMIAIGKKPVTNLLGYSIVHKDEKLVSIFGDEVESFIKITRLRLADNSPMLYENTYIPFDKFHNMTEKDLGNRSLYDIFKEDYNEIVMVAHENFSAGLSTDIEAKHLKIERNSPVLEIYRTTLNMNNEMIEYTESKARPDKFTYQTIHYNHLNK